MPPSNDMRRDLYPRQANGKKTSDISDYHLVFLGSFLVMFIFWIFILSFVDHFVAQQLDLQINSSQQFNRSSTL